MSTEEILRCLLMANFIAAALHTMALLGVFWPHSGWPIRTVFAGAFVSLIYITAGQVKALELSISFDLYSWLGMLGATIFNLGAFWTLRTDRVWR